MLSHLGSSLEEVKEESDVRVASTEKTFLKVSLLLGKYNLQSCKKTR